jgi:serine/threonine-protein kinase RsbW
VHKTGLADLKIPADPEFISLAKRLAASLGTRLGFTLEALDELNIAIAQGCASAIEAAHDAWGNGGELRLIFSSTDGGMAVDVEAVAPRSAPATRFVATRSAQDDEVSRLSREMIRCFVDDFRYHQEPRSGRVRLRMVKYLIG